MPILFVWIHAFPFGVGYVDQLRRMFPKESWTTLSEEWDFFHRLCEVARTCKDNLKDPRFETLAEEIDACPRAVIGYPDLLVVQIDVASLSQAQSCSKPMILPCKIFHKSTKTYSSQCLLIKHCQSMGSDGFVHLWIEYMKNQLVNVKNTIVTYPTIPIGSYAGILLMVSDSLTLSNLDKKSSIQNKLYDHPVNVKIDRVDINQRFAESVAFFTVLTCFIGLRDRIDSNMMLLPKSQVMFHIDFEYMFNKQPPMKETMRDMGMFVQSFLNPVHQRYSSSSSSSSSHFLEMDETTDTIVMKPLLPDSVMSMLGGHGSPTYTNFFVPSFNRFFQSMWDNRHVLYFSSQFLTFFPSTTKASQLTSEEHNQFFADLANVVLKGSDTYGEFACKVVMRANQTKPWAEKVLDTVGAWSRGSR
jgi:hypothetical protein